MIVGIVAEMEPDEDPLVEPMMTGLEKLPALSESCAVNELFEL